MGCIQMSPSASSPFCLFSSGISSWSSPTTSGGRTGDVGNTLEGHTHSLACRRCCRWRWRAVRASPNVADAKCRAVTERVGDRLPRALLPVAEWLKMVDPSIEYLIVILCLCMFGMIRYKYKLHFHSQVLRVVVSSAQHLNCRLQSLRARDHDVA